MEKKKHTYGLGMRMGLVVLLFSFFGTAVAQNPYPPYDFTVENADGDLLYYRITSATAPYTVAVTRCHDSVYHNLLDPHYPHDIGQPGYLYDLYDYDSSITVPAMVTYNGTDYQVTSVDNEAFFMQKDLKSVTLPSSVKTIQEKAFHRSGIYRIVMPGVERIEESAFYASPLAYVTLPTTLVYIGEAAFAVTSVSQVDIPSGVEVLPSWAFYECPMLKITFHEGLREIGYCAFSAEYIDSLVFPSTLQKIDLFSYDLVGYDPNTDIQCRYVEFKNGSEPLEIDDYCFYSFRNLKTLILSDNIVSIGRRCFERSGIRNIVVPPMVRNIHWYCFADCDSLREVVLPDNLANIETAAFLNTPLLKEVTLPASVVSVGNRAFSHDANVSGGLEVLNCNGEQPFIVTSNTFSKQGTIYVRVPCGSTAAYQSASGWSSYGNLVYEECVGLEDHEPSSFTVYPNPAGEVVYVELDGADIANVALYDLQGRVVETLRATSLQDGIATVNMRNVPAGVYVLRVTDTNGKEYQQKVIKNA
ncbi:MAG: leucine-rich repeat domain-containing protein [Bacteroidales bacterium]|nr:leucine-rich repeat domain-containing protein [Bacteroidales bacterium]